ncbi:hypothetical protein ECANGB1_963 [Enterospora canceri]|uniref:Spindle pole body component n=1 Tax=Enterospora canceri TaxID=1081671 RepID=A0A1Y1S7V8_9MICR|nr:hypothetical protein ECANGB1_963 [Enterospora canceri]
MQGDDNNSGAKGTSTTQVTHGLFADETETEDQSTCSGEVDAKSPQTTKRKLSGAEVTISREKPVSENRSRSNVVHLRNFSNKKETVPPEPKSKALLLVEKLYRNLLSIKETPQTNYTPKTKPFYAQPVDISKLLNETERAAYAQIETEEGRKLAYALYQLRHSQEHRTVLGQIESNILSIALGMSLSGSSEIYLNNKKHSMDKIKQQIPLHLFNALKYIVQYAMIYKRVKSETSHPQNETHREFLKDASQVVSQYETTLISLNPTGLTETYASMYSSYMKMYQIDQISKEIKTKNYKSILVSEYHRRVIDRMTVLYLQTGDPSDQYGEYFIKNDTVDYGLIPEHMANKEVEEICYVGKYAQKLRYKNIHLPEQHQDLGLLKLSLNRLYYTHYHETLTCLFDFISDVFLFRRVDFIDFLFDEFKENRNLNKKSLLSIIEEGITRCKIRTTNHASLDIQAETNSAEYFSADGSERVYLEEPFSLYCRFSPDICGLIDAASTSHKLSLIFRVLWKIKRLENLSIYLRSHSPRISLVIQNLLKHLYYDTIDQNQPKLKWNFAGLALDEISSDFSAKIDQIIGTIKNSHLERVLCSIEVLLVKLGRNLKSGIVSTTDDGLLSEIVANIKEYANDCSSSGLSTVFAPIW